MGIHQMPRWMRNGKLPAPSATPVKLWFTSEGYCFLAYGTAVPDDGTSGYQKGAMFWHTDASDGEDALLRNVGTASSCNFDVSEVSVEAGDVSITDAGGYLDAANVEDAIQEIFTLLASTSNGEGAGLIGIEDDAGNFTATTVEAAIAEIIADYAAITNGNGASKIGLEDADGYFSAANVEAAFKELVEDLAAITNGNGASLIGVEDTNSYWTAANVEALSDEIATETHTHTFTGTALSADATTVKHDNSAATNGTALYLMLERGVTEQGMLASETANGATTYVETGAGLSIPVIEKKLEDTTFTCAHNASASTAGGPIYAVPTGGVNKWGAQEVRLESESAGGANTTIQSASGATPADKVPVYFRSFTNQITIPLATVRECGTNALQTITDTPKTDGQAEGLLGVDTTPKLDFLNVDTDSALGIEWGTEDITPVAIQFGIPNDADLSKDIKVYIRAKMGSANGDTPQIAADWYANEGDTKNECNLNSDVSGTTIGTYYWTLANASLPAGSQTITMELTPEDAHDSDPLIITHIFALYTPLHDGIALTFDEDGGTGTGDDDGILIANNPCEVDMYVRCISGRPVKIHHGTSGGVQVYLDYDGGQDAEMLASLPGTADVTMISDTDDGLFALDGLYITPIYYDDDGGSGSYGVLLAAQSSAVDAYVFPTSGNRMLPISYAADPGSTGTVVYYDDNGATADEKLLSDNAGGADTDCALSGTYTVYGTVAAGTNAVKTIRNT